MMLTVEVACPRCGTDVPVSVEETGGDLVPWGSTTACLPKGFSVSLVDHACPGLDESDIRIMEELACEAASELDPDYPDNDEDG
jgi:hypothetical protein